MQKLVLAVASASLLAACTGGVTPPDSSTGQQSSLVAQSSSSIAVAVSSSAPAISSEAAMSSIPTSSSSSAASSAPVVVSSSTAASSSVASANLKTIFAINVGADVNATLNGITYEPEGLLAPSLMGATNGVSVVTDDIADTTEDKLYQSQRYGLYTYELPVTQGTYNVTLHFAESYAEMATTRVMSAVAENKVVMNNVDLFDVYNGAFKAVDISLNDIEVNDGSLTIEFTAMANLATLSGILVTSEDGSRGEIVIPPNPCEGTDNYVCLDFENVNAGAAISGYTMGKNVSVVANGNAHSGTKSLKFYSDNVGDNYGTSYLKSTSGFPGKQWGRLFYKIDKVSSAFMHTTFAAFRGPDFEARIVDTVKNADGKHTFLYNVQVDGSYEYATETPYIYNFTNNWTCVEWHLDNTTQTYEFYREGTMISEISGKVNDKAIPATLTWMAFGAQVYQPEPNGPNIEGYLDDIVVGPARIGCN